MKSSKFSIIALIVSLAICTTTVYAISNTNDKIIVTEEVLFGDINSVSNLNINMKTQMDNKHIWDIQTPIGNAENSVVDYNLYSTRQYANDDMPEYIDMHLQLAFSTSTSGVFDLKNDFQDELHIGKLYVPMLIIEDVASRTDLNSTHTETVLLSDYYEYYELGIDTNLQLTNDTEIKNYLSVESHDIFQEYFQIPVGNDKLAITITKNNEGVNYIACESVGDTTFIVSHSVVLENEVFLAIGLEEATGGTREYTRIGNTEIYHFDLIGEGQAVDIGEITKVKTLSDGVYLDGFIEFNGYILALENNVDKSELVVYSNAEDNFKEIQRISLSDYAYLIEDLKNAIIIHHSNDIFTVITEENGVFSIEFETKAEQIYDDTTDKDSYNTKASFIDGKLIVLTEYCYYYRYMGDILISVYDESGLTFAGLYSLSQKNEMLENSNYSVRFEDFYVE